MKIKSIILVCIFAFAYNNLNSQVSKLSLNDAKEILMKQNPDYFNGDNNLYVYPKPLPANSDIKDVILVVSPNVSSWFFFLDKSPYQNWSHPCLYIFIDEVSGQISTIEHNLPPNLDDMKPLVLKKITKSGSLYSFAKLDTRALTFNGTNDYAVIINGGWNNTHNYERYWNDISAFYSMLVNVYGFDRSHIYVINSDGTSSVLDRVIDITYDIWGNPTYTRDSSPLDLDGDGSNDINYSATKSNISTVFNTLSGILDSEDHLYIFNTGHGGQTSGSDVYLMLWNSVQYRDDEFAIELNKVHPGRISVFMEQCRSGGFIDDLDGDYRVIATACTADEDSYGRSWEYDEFVYHWIGALAGETPDGMPVDADVNNDNWVSFREAFVYSEAHDLEDETPQYNSITNGLGFIMRPSDNCYISKTSPYLICTAGKTITVNNLPPLAYITWNHSTSTLERVSAQGANPCIFRAKSGMYGASWIDATINIASFGNATLPRLNNWAGKFESTVVTGQAGVCPNSLYTYIAQVPGGHKTGYSYSWTYPSNWYNNGIIQNNINLQTPLSPQYGTVRVAITNECGTSGYSGITVYPGYNCGSYFTIYPNPAENVLNININKLDLSPDSLEAIPIAILDLTQDLVINVYNNNGLLLKSFKKTGLSFSIGIDYLDRGNYIIEVTDGHLRDRQPFIKK